MGKLTKTLINDVLKSKEDIKSALNESIQNTFREIIKENISELLEEKEESFDDEEILSKEKEESEVESAEEETANDTIVSTDVNDDVKPEDENVEGETETKTDEVGEEGYGELKTIDLRDSDVNQSYDIFMEISDDAIANMVSDDELELLDTKSNKKFIFKKNTLEECLVKNKKMNESEEFDDTEESENEKKSRRSVFGLSPYDSTKAFEFDDDINEEVELEIDEELLDGIEDAEDSEDVIYEIELDDETDLEETAFAGSKTFQTGMKQHGKFSTQRSKQVSRGTIGESKERKESLLIKNKLEESNQKITKLLEEKLKLKQVIKESVDTLNEISVSYTNLLNATRILHNFSTTKDEKTKILSYFDECKTINESNELFNKLKTKLEKVEKIVDKEVINENKKESSEKGLIVEKTSYVSNELQDMVSDLILRMEKRK